MSAPYVKLDTPLGEHTVVCRGCLANCGEMKNLREWGLIEDFRKYSGVKLCRSDGVSELICSSCEECLMKCKLFAQRCKNSDIALRNYIANNPKVEKKNGNTLTFNFNEKELIYSVLAPDMDLHINIPCPYKCKQTYIKKIDILNHLIKDHEHKKDYMISYQYYCWFPECSYNKISIKNKYFASRKYVNQHYNKVHRPKHHHCEKCNSDFATLAEFTRHHDTCNMVFNCEDCNKGYANQERLIVHLMRKHPEKHKQYKESKEERKRKAVTERFAKKPKITLESLFDSPKRSFATQTNPKDSIKNDVTLPSWQNTNNEISTQTGFEDLLSIKSNSEDESLFYSETTLSDIQTQTFPLEFGLVVKRSNKETLTETIDKSIKGTQTCFCYCDSPKFPFGFIDSVSSSPRSGNLTSTETQTAEFKSSVMSDVLLSLNSTETQTCFDEAFKESL